MNMPVSTLGIFGVLNIHNESKVVQKFPFTSNLDHSPAEGHTFIKSGALSIFLARGFLIHSFSAIEQIRPPI